jgi:hypothetical protein
MIHICFYITVPKCMFVWEESFVLYSQWCMQRSLAKIVYSCMQWLLGKIDGELSCPTQISMPFVDAGDFTCSGETACQKPCTLKLSISMWGLLEQLLLVCWGYELLAFVIRNLSWHWRFYFFGVFWESYVQVSPKVLWISCSWNFIQIFFLKTGMSCVEKNISVQKGQKLIDLELV